MSNRDGKNAKPRSSKMLFKIGGGCPRCQKGKLERVYPKNHPKKHWREYVMCKTCNYTNF